VRSDRKPTHSNSRLRGDSPKATALRVARAAFEGLAPLFVEHGITSPEVEALLRTVLVHAAAKTQNDLQRPNVSRVSVKTGVDRHLVAALLKDPPNAERGATLRRDAVSRVIDGWLSDPQYSDKGAPHDLDIGDPGSKGRTVWSLAQRYAPGVWPRLIVDELIRVDYVDTLPNGQLRCKPARGPKLASRRSNRDGSGQLMRDAVQALFRDEIRPDAKPSWCTARSLEIDEQDLPLIRKMMRERLSTMFAWITDELNSTRWQHNGASANARVRVGVSGFTFEEILPRDSANEQVDRPRRSKP